ncbi:DUF5819 family protein [Streptomyces sp. 796.1]|uniref:DUF5819 family protein n=1 Tax=Streptomyces sp. 796.1 TaxID=3163029 RepID=UPI0039C922F5
MQPDERAERSGRAGADGEGPGAGGSGADAAPRQHDAVRTGGEGVDGGTDGVGRAVDAGGAAGSDPQDAPRAPSGRAAEPGPADGDGEREGAFRGTTGGTDVPAGVTDVPPGATDMPAEAGVSIPGPRTGPPPVGSPGDPAGAARHSAGSVATGSAPTGSGPASGTPTGGTPGAAPGALSLPGQVVLGVAIAVAVVAVAVHLGMSFLHVAPSNTVNRKHTETIGEYIYPEFEQNWKLFAPNPLQQNIAVQARAEVRTPDGGKAVTGWTDLTAQDGAAVRHNPLPSHAQQNQLRRAWEFYAGSHDAKEQPVGLRGQLSEQYVRRMVAHRFGPEHAGGVVERVQVRAVTEPVAPPSWSEEKIDLKPIHRVLPWWTITSDDLPGHDGPDPDDRARAAVRPENDRVKGDDQ